MRKQILTLNLTVFTVQTNPKDWLDSICKFLSPVLTHSFQSIPGTPVSFIYIGHEKTNAQLGIDLMTPLSEMQHLTTEPLALSTSIVKSGSKITENKVDRHKLRASWTASDGQTDQPTNQPTYRHCYL